MTNSPTEDQQNVAHDLVARFGRNPKWGEYHMTEQHRRSWHAIYSALAFSTHGLEVEQAAAAVLENDDANEYYALAAGHFFFAREDLTTADDDSNVTIHVVPLGRIRELYVSTASTLMENDPRLGQWPRDVKIGFEVEGRRYDLAPFFKQVHSDWRPKLVAETYRILRSNLS